MSTMLRVLYILYSAVVLPVQQPALQTLYKLVRCTVLHLYRIILQELLSVVLLLWLEHMGQTIMLVVFIYTTHQVY